MTDTPIDYHDLGLTIGGALRDGSLAGVLAEVDYQLIDDAVILVLERVAQALDVDAIRADPLLWEMAQPSRDRILRACLAVAPIPPAEPVVVNHSTTWTITHQHGCPNEGVMPTRGACGLCGVLVEAVDEGTIVGTLSDHERD